MTDLYRVFAELLEEECIIENVSLAKHTSFNIGGPADLFLAPKTDVQLIKALEICRINGVRHMVLGKGSNVLFSDEGYRGVIISTEGLNFCGFSEDGIIHAGAGLGLGRLAGFALSNQLTGLEFASGIPGTVGGAVFMNAGAYDGEISQVFVSCEAVNEKGEILRISKEQAGFGYRTSAIQRDGLVVLSADFSLEKGVREEIKAKSDRFNKSRREKQPLEFPSAGSTFKRPQGHFAGKLIMDAGLRGFQIGGAAVSEKHCGFVVNKNGATASDVLAVMEHVEKTVMEKFDVWLEPEVRIIPE